MIGKLTGIIAQKTPPKLLLDVNGVGYEVSASMNTFTKLPSENELVSLFIHMQTRDDGSYLFGFYDENERIIFKELIKVSGVGPKLALTILSGMDIAGLGQCIMERQVSRLVKLPGVGKKTAERLIVELHDRLNQLSSTSRSFSQILIQTNDDGKSNEVQEAISALESLGYKLMDATKAVDAVFSTDLSRDMLIRNALKRLSSVA